MTGYHNGHCRLDDHDSDSLRADDVTLAARLKAAGVEGKWKAVWMRDTLRLFELEADPGERTDVSAQ
jgi:hypothetical protein